MTSPEYLSLAPAWPNLAVIKNLKERDFINRTSPHWWSTDYEPDPREFLSFEEFAERLIPLGKAKARKYSDSSSGNPRNFFNPYNGHGENSSITRDVCLYPEGRVPITIVTLKVDGQNLPFFVTARPCPGSGEFGISVGQVTKTIKSGETLKLPEMYYPHIRGLFAGKRGNHFFLYDYNDYTGGLRAALDLNGLSFLNIWSGREKRYSGVWSELESKKNLVDGHRPMELDFPHENVSAEEFLSGRQRVDHDLVVFYPLRLPNIRETLPMVISTRTHKESRLRIPTVLGVFAENGSNGYCRRGGILRIKDRQTAETVSRLLTRDFGIPIDTALFIPTPGRPKYERISG